MSARLSASLFKLIFFLSFQISIAFIKSGYVTRYELTYIVTVFHYCDLRSKSMPKVRDMGLTRYGQFMDLKAKV